MGPNQSLEILSNYFSPFSLHERASICISVHQNRPAQSLPFCGLKNLSKTRAINARQQKNKMTLNSPAIPSAPADAVSLASTMFDAGTIFSQPPVFTVENQNLFHNSSLLPYSSLIAPPLLANTRLGFSVKIIGQWSFLGCGSRAFIGVSGNQSCLQPKQKLKPNAECSKNNSAGSDGTGVVARHDDGCRRCLVSGSDFHA